ncbi:outer membrane protein assembly factor BamE [Patescibacteria group bacterium]|nr:outer membrane protein assembly factor BamE [Patescibacteria group bacterium]
MRRYLLICSLIPFLVGCATTGNVPLGKRVTKAVVVTGYAKGEESREALREKALLDAFKKGARSVVGTFLSSYSEVKMFKLLDNSISSKTSAYIEKYDILDERQELDKYAVKVKMWVNVSRLYDNLGIRTISTREDREKNYPKGMIIINPKLTKKSYSGIMLNNTGGRIYKPTVFIYPFDENGKPIVSTDYTAILNYNNRSYVRRANILDDFIRIKEYCSFEISFNDASEEVKDVDVKVEGYGNWSMGTLYRFKMYFVTVGKESKKDYLKIAEEAPPKPESKIDLSKLPHQPKWKNWRQLQKGMTQDQVRRILGEPKRIVAAFSSSIVWFYPDSGKIEFWESDKTYKLKKWIEPYWK